MRHLGAMVPGDSVTPASNALTPTAQWVSIGKGALKDVGDRPRWETGAVRCPEAVCFHHPVLVRALKSVIWL